ncbi:MAG: DNA alkylation repair protein [Clostridia bacterium]|nr:DNA alkylation repair protein [Clostridia bacterium]
MELIRDSWNKEDGENFQNYLRSLQRKSKIEWTKNSLKTDMPVLAIMAPTIKDISKQITKGNYREFLNLRLWDFYENTAIYANIISSIKDFDELKTNLEWYSKKVDNWASCDALKINIKGKEKEIIELSKEYIKSKKPFVRRIGVILLFKLVKKDEFIKEIFEILNSFENEKEYYVNMVNAWLICECFIHKREETINFLNTHKLNKFTLNKAIQKCRESYRISLDDKNMLLKYKVME